MSDFIQEVDEAYRRDRMASLFAKYQVPLAILAVAIIAGAGFWRYWSDAQVTAAEKVNERYEAASTLAKDGKGAEAQAAFLALVKDGPAGYAALARMRAAAVQAGSDPEAAAKTYDAIALDESLAASLRDAARYRSALLRVDSEDPKAFETRYGRFAAAGVGFHNSMRELLAVAAMKRGDYPAAGKFLDEIIIDGEAPQALRGRAQAFRQLVGAGPAGTMDKQPGPAAVDPPPAQPDMPAGAQPMPKAGATPPAPAAPTATPH